MMDAIQRLRESLQRSVAQAWSQRGDRAETIDANIETIANVLCEHWTRCDCWPYEARIVRHVRTSLAVLEAEPEVVKKYSQQIANRIRAIRNMKGPE